MGELYRMQDNKRLVEAIAAIKPALDNKPPQVYSHLADNTKGKRMAAGQHEMQCFNNRKATLYGTDGVLLLCREAARHRGKRLGARRKAGRHHPALQHTTRAQTLHVSGRRQHVCSMLHTC